MVAESKSRSGEPKFEVGDVVRPKRASWPAEYLVLSVDYDEYELLLLTEVTYSEYLHRGLIEIQLISTVDEQGEFVRKATPAEMILYARSKNV